MFKGFHTPTTDSLTDAWSSESTLFIFDTNVFLNLYGYEEQTRKDFFEVLKSLGEKVWIPYHVGLEYQRRRLEVVKDEKAVFSKINDLLEKIEKTFDNDFNEFALKRRFPKLHENTDKLKSEVKKSLRDYKKSVDYWDKKQPCVRSHDIIRSAINDIFENKVGARPDSQEWLDNLYKEGEKRYENCIPPGFKDAVKGKAPDNTFDYDELAYQRQFGDLILWKQLIIKAKEDSIKSVIFVTDDSKEDWWYILDSRGKKQIGPHASLQNEIYKESKIDMFHMYNTYQFLNDGKDRLNIGIHESSIIDANSQFKQSLENERRKNEFLEIQREKELFELQKKKLFKQKELMELQSEKYLREKELLEYQKMKELEKFQKNSIETLFHHDNDNQIINSEQFNLNYLKNIENSELFNLNQLKNIDNYEQVGLFKKYLNHLKKANEDSDDEM
ncbi:PIN-like domain-containing protein [Vibrio sp. 2-Bac 85]